MTGLPESMTVIAISEPGGPDVLKAEQRPFLPLRKTKYSFVLLPPASIVPMSSSARVATRRRKDPPTCPVSKLPARWRPWERVCRDGRWETRFAP